MLTLPEWLQLVGLQGRNPFANKQADDEREWLEAVFVEHPAYNAMAREAEPRSSILHAARGAGKTTTCTMFEHLCIEEAAHRRPLVVRLQEWIPLVDLLDQPLHSQVNGYLELLFGHVVLALLATCDAAWITSPDDPSLRSYLAWFCTRYADRLTDQELARLIRSSRLLREPPVPIAAPPHRLSRQPPLQQLRWLLRALRAANVRTVYILVDRVDEVAVTVARPERGADLLLPLLGNLELLELEGLVIKCFIPTAIVEVLRARSQLREDRVRCYDLTWADATGVLLLRKLLQNRLSHFSGGAVQSLAALADSSLRDIDDQVSRAAAGSPRQLLILSENLLLARAADATGEDLLIRPRHVSQVLVAAAEPSTVVAPTAPGSPALVTPAYTAEPAAGSEASAPEPAASVEGATPPPSQAPATGGVAPQHTALAHPQAGAAAGVPLLTLGADGCIARGGIPIAGWQHLPSRQREVLRYLFGKPNTMCHCSELGRNVWNDVAVSDDTVRKVMHRLSEFLHRELSGEPYLEKITGGYYVLRHAVAVPVVAQTPTAADDEQPPSGPAPDGASS